SGDQLCPQLPSNALFPCVPMWYRSQSISHCPVKWNLLNPAGTPKIPPPDGKSVREPSQKRIAGATVPAGVCTLGCDMKFIENTLLTPAELPANVSYN